ncbi:hypothetical protein G7B21_29430, partial [Klebsiella pneumoniae]|nr:hypothetical protein [Klebsiella pneumoniae]
WGCGSTAWWSMPWRAEATIWRNPQTAIVIGLVLSALGMWVNGLVVDALARRGYDLAKPANGDCYRSGA